MTIRNYVRAQSLEEAYTLNQKKQNRILGGMLWLKLSGAPIGTAIDLGGLGLDTIEETAEEFSIGAMVSLRQLERHAGLNAYTCGAAAKAVEPIVGVQLRNLATVGGSVFSRFGFSDVLTLFLALDTEVELYRAGVMPLERFAAMEKDRDILVRLIVHKTPGRFAYQSMRNNRTDLPTLTCAAAELAGKYRLVIGARPGRAVVLRDTRGLLAHGVDEAAAAAFAAQAAEEIPTGSNSRAGADYRRQLVRVLGRRALLELGGR